MSAFGAVADVDAFGARGRGREGYETALAAAVHLERAKEWETGGEMWWGWVEWRGLRRRWVEG